MRVDEIEDQNLVPDGVYPFRIKKIEIKNGPKSTYLNCELTITGVGEGAGRSLFDRIMLGPKSLFRVKNFLLAFGQGGAELNSVDKDPLTKQIRVDENAFGREIISLVQGGEACADVGTEEERENKETGEKYPKRNKVRSYLPIEEAGAAGIAWPE